MLNRRTLLATGSASLALGTLAAPAAALAQGRKDALVLGMTLEPTGLDPTASAAASSFANTISSLPASSSAVSGRVPMSRIEAMRAPSPVSVASFS